MKHILCFFQSNIKYLRDMLVGLMISSFVLNAISGDMEEGDEAFNKKDYSTAFKKYRQASDKGDPIANLSLGTMYDGGLGVKQDFQEAIRYYKIAASQGNPLGFAFIGAMYENGQGVEKNLEVSEKWKKAALICNDKKSKKCELPN